MKSDAIIDFFCFRDNVGMIMFIGSSCENVLEPARSILGLSQEEGIVHTVKNVVYRRYNDGLISNKAECHISVLIPGKLLFALC